MKSNFLSVMTDFEICAIYEYAIIICIINIKYWRRILNIRRGQLLMFSFFFFFQTL